MSEFQPISDEDNIWLKPRQKRVRRVPTEGIPWGSWACGILCVALFLLIHATGGPRGSLAISHATYPDAREIWTGAYWGPLTSAFVHTDPLHLLFNLLWLRLFGPAMERHFGSPRFLLFVAFTAYLTSTCQLAFSDNAGIGFSGVNYALFGFLWMARFRIPDLEAVVTDNVVKFMLAWLVIAPFISKLGYMPIGNAAHNSGLILGILTGAVCVLQFKRAITLPLLILTGLILLVPVIRAPWSTTWMWYAGLDALQAGDYQTAVDYYDRVLEREPNESGARTNHDIASEALKYEQAEEEMGRAYESIKGQLQEKVGENDER